ncbi:MAG: LysM peptidoglycan-binding domain-containing protein [Gammaproteobacteria bacterium]|nr:LysM peptidoglycan-binding domain-containing protein [Gammaproteobacteria bacterium]MCY4217751.1 LysM peptidoglycan-binding domain-containing protein [Gammaproteobacteria bacterium]
MRKILYPVFALLLLSAVAIVVPNSAHAHHFLDNTQLYCSEDFPCPKALQGRVIFWAHVFHKWGKTDAVFHDPDVPERVYSVVDTGRGCSNSVKSSLNKERKRLKTALYNTAKKLESSAKLTQEEEHLASLFPSKNPNQLRKKSEKIRCQSGIRDSFIKGLERFNRYSYMVDNILAQYNLHPDIRYLPFVESTYNPRAYSKAGAAGMWQIMPSTARTLGLQLDATIDERLDPEAATHGAARYLTESRASLTKLARRIDPSVHSSEISPFVITSYNYGVNGMRRAIKKVNPDYMQVLEKYRSPSFRTAVKNFYASFLAARHVVKNAEQYFGKELAPKPVQVFTVVLNNPTSIDRIKQVFGFSEQDLRPINLGLTRFIWNGWRMVPSGYKLKLPYRDDEYRNQIAHLKSLPRENPIAESGSYVVRKGDTACGIARALQINCRELISANQLGKRALIRVGQKLIIPGGLFALNQSDSTGAERTVIQRTSLSRNQQTHRVAKGDTACDIARKYSVSCRELIRLNNLGRKAIIRAGQRLKIPSTGNEKRELARLDEGNRYLVVKGDSACRIAKRFNVNCNELIRLNNLNQKATIFPGQRIRIPGFEAPQTNETVTELAQLDKAITESESKQADILTGVARPELDNLLDTIPDLSVRVSQTGSSPVYSIIAMAEETLGHYADWLGIGYAGPVRKLNSMSVKASLSIGRKIRLPIDSVEQISRFERKRLEFHQILNEELKENYRLVEIRNHVVNRGDTVWKLATEVGFPVSLFYRLNPDLLRKDLVPGQPVLIPILRERA